MELANHKPSETQRPDEKSELEQLAEQLERFTKLIANMRSQMRPGAKSRPVRAYPLGWEELRALLLARGSLTVAEVSRELHGMPISTAARLMRLYAHSGEGILVYEPFGHTDRLRLYRPDKVLFEK